MTLLALQPEAERVKILSKYTDEQLDILRFDWLAQCRPNQKAPAGDWLVWIILAGRGFGKTRCITEWARDKAQQQPGCRIAIVGATAGDVRDVLIEGESGMMNISPPWYMPIYEPSKRRLTWPNGSIATTYTADEPNRLRGPQHHYAICDELAAWRYPEAWDMLMFGLRLGEKPQAAVATTPRPIEIIKALIKHETTHVTRGTTFDNLQNLAPAFFDQITAKYKGTRLGRQELYAEILDDVPGALWARDILEESRVTKHPDLVRVVVGVDPAASTGETGIVVAGVGTDGHGYILDDLSTSASPQQWGAQAVTGYHKHQADRIAVEANNGGDMCIQTIKTIDPKAATKKLWASRGKQTRAEPIAALYEQGKVHHVGMFAALEDEYCTWVPGESDSPNHLDAAVWALTELMLNKAAVEYQETNPFYG